MPVILATQDAEKPDPTNSSRALISKKTPSQKRAGEVAQGIGLEFKLQYCKKQKQTRQGSPWPTQNTETIGVL
jgi:hypothetical protein